MFYGVSSVYYTTLNRLENDGILNIDDPRHMSLVHFIFIPRLRESLRIFMDAWNNHPISSEHNYTPRQLMIMNLPPEEFDIHISQANLFFSSRRV